MNSSRREFLKVGTAASALALINDRVSVAVPKKTDSQLHVDNVIVIVSDTLRRDALSLYGQKWIRTPNLDRFAEKAVVFNNAYLSSFPTVLLRNDLMTGRYTFTYKPWSPIDFDAVTLPGTLNKAGILTSCIVDPPDPYSPGYNYQRDFGVWKVTRGQEDDRYRSAPKDVKLPCSPNKLRRGAEAVTQYLRNVAHRECEEDYFAPRTMTEAATWLEENLDGRRFFLYVDTFDPHEPWDPPNYYVEPYDPGYTGEQVIYPRYDFWREYLTEAELKHCRALYAGEVSMVDRWIGFLLDRIESLGLLQNTAVVVLSDHGYYLGEHGYIGKTLIRDNFYQYFPLYPEVARVPMLIYHPGCRGGSRLDALVQPVDVMPTVLDLLGVSLPSTVEGSSLVPLLSGRVSRIKEFTISSPVLYYENRHATPDMPFLGPDHSARSSITDGDWLLIYGAQVVQGAGISAAVDSQLRSIKEMQGLIVPELYQISQDPGCVKNLFNEKHSIAEDLHRQYFDFLRKRKIPESQLKYYEDI